LELFVPSTNPAINFNAGSHLHGTTLTVSNNATVHLNPGSVYDASGSSNFFAGFQCITTFNGAVSSVGSAVNINGGANVIFNQDVSTTTLSLVGILGGSGTVNVSGLLTWASGSMGGTGTTNANGGMVLSESNLI